MKTKTLAISEHPAFPTCPLSACGRIFEVCTPRFQRKLPEHKEAILIEADRRRSREAILVHKTMKRFLPDEWLVYEASAKNPDLFGRWPQWERRLARRESTKA